MVFKSAVRTCPTCGKPIAVGENLCLNCGRQARANPIGGGKRLILAVTGIVVVIVVAGTVLGLGTSQGHSASTNCSVALTNMVVATSAYSQQHPNGTNTPYYSAYASDEQLISWVSNEAGLYVLNQNSASYGLAQAFGALNKDAIKECAALHKSGVNIATISSD